MNRILRSIRLFFGVALVSLGCGTVAAAPIAIVQGAESIAESEQRFAASLAKHVERWYRSAGVQTLLCDDTALGQSLSGKTVAVLVYLSQPKPPQIAALRAFVQRGGKLIVCYSASPALAALMDVQVVRYLKDTTDGRWSRMCFVEDRPQGVPASILQTSSNIFQVQPIPGRSSVLAWWHDRQGKKTEQPAWLRSKNGYWMTHVLLADGDAEAKGRLLLALAASFDPSLWIPAADNVIRHGRAAERTVCNAVKSAPRDCQKRVAGSVDTMIKCNAAADRALREGRGFEAWMAGSELQNRAAEVYGMLQVPRKGEIRAVWDHSGMGLFPGDWPRTMKLLAEAGMTDIYVNVAGAGFAHFPSSVLPRSRVYEEQGDQLTACIKAAKPYHISVHAWILCFSTEGATQDRIRIFSSRDNWLLENSGGRPWLDPGSPEVRAYLLRAVREMARSYAVAGIHLDFVRYPDFVSCLNANTKQRFEQGMGKSFADWPETVRRAGKIRQSFFEWRAEQVTDFVRRVRTMMQREAKGKVLSAAVYGKYPSCYEAVGQDWQSWIDLGLVDFVMPMNYTENMDRFQEWVKDQTKTKKMANAMIPGIGVTAAESRLDAMQVIDQIKMARAAGCAGFALFDLDTTLRQEILPILRLGISRKPLPPPR
ncbi:MAG: family 10 glycosylhydrolase [Kiritimatiellae bacterium]|nr:family 10 glycosylhydrolase [Kiritimatiellia bacterium]